MKKPLAWLAMLCAELGLVFHRLHGRLCLASLWLMEKTGEPMPDEVRIERDRIRASLREKA